MPRAKRPLVEIDPNQQPPPQVLDSSEAQKPKRQRTSAKTQFEKSSFTGKYEYMCIGRPPWADTDTEEEGGEDDAEQNKLVHQKPITEYPEWKWFMLNEAFALLDAAYKDADNRDPDRFGMYVYNDYFGYGLIEVLENMLRAFNREMKPQKGKQYNYQQMWAIVTTLANFLNRDVSVPWRMVDDSQRCERLAGMFGCVILTALNELDRIGQLKKDSRFLDLGHYPTFTLGSDGEEQTESDPVDWREAIVGYAKKAKIDLSTQGVSGLDNLVVGPGEEYPIGKAKVERWNWTLLLRDYREDYLFRPTILALSSDNIGGDGYNLLKWTRSDRAKYAFDKKDPLAAYTDEQIEDGGFEL